MLSWTEATPSKGRWRLAHWFSGWGSRVRKAATTAELEMISMEIQADRVQDWMGGNAPEHGHNDFEVSGTGGDSTCKQGSVCVATTLGRVALPDTGSNNAR